MTIQELHELAEAIRHISAKIKIARVCQKNFASVDANKLSYALAMLKKQQAEIEQLKTENESLRLEKKCCKGCEYFWDCHSEDGEYKW